MKKFNLGVLIFCIVLSCFGILNIVRFMKYNQTFYIVGAVLDGLAIITSVVCTVLHVMYYRKHQKETNKFWAIALCVVTVCSTYFLIGQLLFVFKGRII